MTNLKLVDINKVRQILNLMVKSGLCNRIHNEALNHHKLD